MVEGWNEDGEIKGVGLGMSIQKDGERVIYVELRSMMLCLWWNGGLVVNDGLQRRIVGLKDTALY